jgi:DNA-binding CsgD family transcriptional regulator
MAGATTRSDRRQVVQDAFLAAVCDITAALNELPSPTVLIDPSGTIRWQNRASVELRGHRVGRDMLEFVAPEDAAAARGVFARVLANGGTVDLRVRMMTAHGAYVGSQERWIGLPVRDGHRVVVVIGLGDAPTRRSAPRLPSDRRLTPRQTDILRLLSAGTSTAGIANALSLSPTTVRNHIANLLAELGVHSRLEAVAVARAAGLLDR